MAAPFTPAGWALIRDRLAENELRYGLPQRRAGSVVLASFNIRKCGDNAGTGLADLDKDPRARDAAGMIKPAELR